MQGSVQHVDWLDTWEKLVFRTGFEIDQRAILRLGAQRQKRICQGQSLNLWFSADEDEEYVAEIHQEAVEDENITGIYYAYSKAGVTASKGECIACQ
jgi:ribonucleoside-diphosphate reductase alpha chain